MHDSLIVAYGPMIPKKEKKLKIKRPVNKFKVFWLKIEIVWPSHCGAWVRYV